MRPLGLVMMMATLAACSAAPQESAPAAPMTPDVQTREVTYEYDGTSLKGLLAWDANITTPRPGVLVVHEWWGHDDHTRNQARRLAESGYVAFALDMYGDGKVAEGAEEAQHLMTEATADPAVVAGRLAAAWGVLKDDAHVNPEQMAAIGYCFGGAVVLDSARGGTAFDAVVSFHGLLSTTRPAQPGQIKGRVLVLTGDADLFVPAEQVEAFRKEMTDAGANFDVRVYPGAKHGFTNPNAATHGMTQIGYDASADEQSWKAMLDLFSEVFGTKVG